MSLSFKISENEYQLAKKAAQLEHRSIQGQLEYWIKIGRCVLANPDLPVEMIQRLIVSDWHDQSNIVPFNF